MGHCNAPLHHESPVLQSTQNPLIVQMGRGDLKQKGLPSLTLGARRRGVSGT